VADPKRERAEATTVEIGSGAKPHEEAKRPETKGSAFDPPADRFDERGELGRGGMGRVVDAFDRALGRQVAVKHMLSEDVVDLARFEREARITARLEHPGIVPIHDAGRSADGTPYYVMRKVDGRPLEDLVVETTRFEARLALVPNVLAACDAAAYAHARGVIHRDIKPTNLLIGPFGETLLIDWGLARELGDPADDGSEGGSGALTRAGAVAGTPGFMAPEQARGEPVDTSTDVFALGATLFYVLAGRPPFTSSRATEMIHRASEDHPPDWELLPTEVPADLRAIVAKAMSTAREERYRDAGALAADLRRFVTGNLVAAHRYGLFEQLRRFVRRHRATVGVAVISVALLAVGGVLSVRRIIAERDDATDARALAEQKQREATASADLMLVQRARELVERNPDAAIALLRQLRADSVQWPIAADVAQAAALRGIAFGFTTRYHFTHFEMSPNGRLLFACDFRGGNPLVVFDLVARTRRDVATMPQVNWIHWLDDDHIVAVRGRRTLVEFDVATGHTRERDVGQIENFEIKGGVMFARDTAGELLRMAGFSAVSERIATGVHDFDVAIDGDSVAIIHVSGALELWTPARSYAIAQVARDVAVIAAHDRIAWVDGIHVEGWQIRDGKPERVGRWDVSNILMLSFGPTTLYASGGDGIFALDDTGVHQLARGAWAHVAASHRGIAASASNGSVILIDSNGPGHIGARAANYGRLLVGADGRFVVGINDQRDVMVWDVPTFRPHGKWVDEGGMFVGATEHAVWTRDTLVLRHDLVTADQRVIIDLPHAHVFASDVYLDRSGTMLIAVMLSPKGLSGELAVFDAETGKPLTKLTRDTANTLDLHGILVGKPDGSVVEMTNQHGFSERTIARLPGAPEAVYRTGHWVAAIIGNDALRVDLDTGAVVRTHVLVRPEQIAVDARGVMWIRGADSLWRWDGMLPPIRIPTPGKLYDISEHGNGLVGLSPNALLLLDDTPRVIGLGAKAVAVSTTSPWIAGVDPDSGIRAIDARSGGEFSTGFAAGASAQVVVTGNIIGALSSFYDRNNRRRMLFQWVQLVVPAEPAALRRWLATVTNATPVSGSETVLWP
jgi:Protein kinase domain